MTHQLIEDLQKKAVKHAASLESATLVFTQQSNGDVPPQGCALPVFI